jgi:hypothetical protein
MAALETVAVASLACWQAVEVWHHSELTATLRARVQVREGFFADLLGCPYCLSVWVGWLCCLTLSLAAPGYPPGRAGAAAEALRRVAVSPLLGLAASRLANAYNDASRRWCRTPGRAASQDTLW